MFLRRVAPNLNQIWHFPARERPGRHAVEWDSLRRNFVHNDISLHR